MSRGSADVQEISPESGEFEIAEYSGRFDFEVTERRRFQRAQVDAPVSFILYGDRDRVIGRGTARLLDISLDGAFLEAPAIPAAGVHAPDPWRSQRVQFVVLDGPFKGVVAAARPVRRSTEGGVGVRLEAGFNFLV